MALTLDGALARVPQWVGARDLKATPLGGGITNNNFRIDVGGETFVLRIAGADTELLGINREYEYAANLTAGQLGIAPEVYYFIRPEGYLVTRFIPGRPILPEEMCRPESIRRAMDVLRKIHGMPNIPGMENCALRDSVAEGVGARRVDPHSIDLNERRLLNVVEEMVNLIQAQRAYEVNSKAIQAADEMMQQSNNLRR